MTKNPLIRAGIYKHYKGDLYKVISIAKHTETNEDMVIYKSIDSKELWVRPLEMFNEKIKIDGKTIPRFKYIDKS